MKLVALMLTLTGVGVGTACIGDEGTSDRFAVTPTAANSRTTCRAELDALLERVESGDVVAIREQLRFQTLPCTLQLGEGGPPKCWMFPIPQQEGTAVEAFEDYSCAPEWVVADRIDAILGEVVRKSTTKSFRRFAVFEASGKYATGDAEGERYVVVLAEADRMTTGVGIAVVVEEGQIVELWSGCGPEPAGTFIPSGKTAFLIPPPE